MLVTRSGCWEREANAESRKRILGARSEYWEQGVNPDVKK